MQWLPKVMACSRKKPRFRDIGKICLPLGYSQFVRRVPALGDVDKCNDNALYATGLVAVR